MNNTNKIVIAIITLFILGAGGFYLINSQRRSDSTQQGQIIQSHRSYEIEVTSNTDNIKPQQPATFTYRIKNDKGEILKDYEIAHEKIMHFILVRHDLQQFQHLHPEFNQQTGEFTVSVIFPTEGPYRIFPDFTPGDDNPQKLPVTVYSDINVGNMGNYKAQSVVADKQPNKIVKGYDISYTWPGFLEQQKEEQFSLMINKDGQPVTDLENYLGALGHSVILKADSLDFIHTHALDGSMGQMPEMPGIDHSMDNMSTDMSMDGENGPQVKFSTTFPSNGTYKVFTQFQHQGKVITTDYVVTVN